MRSRTLLFLVSVCWLAHPGLTPATDWRQFRGPGGLGISSAKGLPVTWSADSNIAWKTALPGPGSSSPIVLGKKVFVTCYTGYGENMRDTGDIKNLKRHLLCLDRDSGKVLWTKEVPSSGSEMRMRNYLDLHGYASSTPVTDGERVYVFFGISGVLAYDLDGKQLWQVSVGTGTHGWGSATSPVLHKHLLIVNASVESGSLVALDRKTGTEVWRARGISQSWSTPVLVKVANGQTELVVSGSKRVLGFDPDNGKELWHADSFNWYVCPSVVAHDGVVYALQNSACVAVRGGGRGDVTSTHTVWKKNFGTVVSSPVYHDGHIYWGGDTANCMRASDGEVVYRERFKPSAGNIYASPLVADGKIYYVSRTGGTFVLEAGPKFKQLAHNSLRPDTSVFNGSPAVSGSQLLLRSDRYLYCIGKEQ